MARRTVDALATIKANVRLDPKTGCEVWLKGCNDGGYGKTTDEDGKEWYVHRLRYEREVGPLNGRLLRHLCDNPPCCALGHLTPGTQQDNVDDMVARGRHHPGKSLGVAHGSAKLTELQVLAIRADPRSNKATANDYGVSGTLVGLIRQRKIWTHI